MTDVEWAVIRPLLPVPGWLYGRGGQSEVYCHRAMSDAVRYLVDKGTERRAMPGDFPRWDRAYRGSGTSSVSAMLPPSGASTVSTRLQTIAHPWHSCSAAAGSAWMRSASSRSPTTRQRAESSCCSSSPTADGIRGLPGSDDTPDHDSRGITARMSDERKRSPQVRKHNSF
ncbi:transposase [Streptomyces scabiei]|uniref:transposase n=1 Tax=Streptomyces scabiei TaxID=1930 RepID=UPI001F2E892B|nr:transposase [Streptomyces scabiei]